MTAIRVARAATGRDVIAKIEGSYHGHVDQLMYSVLPGADVMGGREAPNVVPQVDGRPGRDGQVDPRGPVQRRRRARAACWQPRATGSPR